MYLRIPRLGVDPRCELAGSEALLLAVSGGPDSMAMLHLLADDSRWEGRLHVATFDHRWSPSGAVTAERVRDYAERLAVPCTVGRAEQADYSEAGARAQRHAFLQATADAEGLDYIAVAHTADDRAETLLLHLLRGTGTTGLGAMGARDGRYVRPLLHRRRAAVREYAVFYDVPFHDDPANQDASYLRARIRTEVLGVLEALRPGALESLVRTALVCEVERDVLLALGRQRLAERVRVSPPTHYLSGRRHLMLDLAGFPELLEGERWLILRAAVRELLGDLADLSLRAVRRLDTLACGPTDQGVLTGWRVTADRCRAGLVLLEACYPGPVWAPQPLPVPGELALPDCGLVAICGPAAEGSVMVCHLAADLAPFEVRMRRDGDRLRPLGRGGSRKLSDLLAEAGVPQVVRDRVPVICAGGQPIAVPGIAVDEAAAGELAVGVRFTAPSGS